MINLDILTRPFATADVKQRKGPSGITLDYLETHSVIARLNEALDGAWDFRILEEKIIEDTIVILAEMTASDTCHQQYGSARTDVGENIGDAYKAAASDALKKCATLFGVGLELYSKTSHTGVTQPQPERAESSDQATDKQIDFLAKMLKQKELPKELEDEVRGRIGAGLTKSAASKYIENLKNWPNKDEQAA